MRKMNLREKIGQMIMTGYSTPELSPDIIRLIEEYKVGNIILFSHNIQSIDQIGKSTRKLHQRIEASTGHPAIISIDQEGGVVTRLPKEASNIPGAMLIGATKNKEYAKEAGRITGKELRALGINMNLAPVLDVNSNPDNPVIGVRSYSSNPCMVKDFGISMMKGLMESGVMATVKHFPGHGDTKVDSHLELPVVEKSLEELMECELIPFQSAILQGAPCLMTSHILFPKLEKEKKPATMSKAILTNLLRDKLGFKGLIVTDCLEMSAIKSYYGTAYGAVEAVKAGAQILCISHTAELVIETIEEIEAAVEAGEIPMEVIDKAVENILAYKEKYKIDYLKDEMGCIDDFEDRKIIKEMVISGITKVSDGELPVVSKNTIIIGSYAYRSTLASSSVDKKLHFAKYLAKHLNCKYIDVPINPESKDRKEILSKLANCDKVVYGLYNGHLNQGQILLANEISRSGYDLIGITLRNPYDLSMLDDKIHKIAAYEYNLLTFNGLIKILKKEVLPKGELPVVLKQATDIGERKDCKDEEG